MKARASINYLYFGFFFVVLLVLNLAHLFLIEQGTFAERSFLVVDIMMQSFIEALLLGLIASLIVKYCPRFFLHLFVLFTFLLFIGHLVDFVLVRLMDLSIWYTINWILDETFDNFLELLLASSISLKSWLLGGGAVVLILGTGILFYFLTQRLSQKSTRQFSYLFIARMLSISIAGLFLWDVFSASFFSAHFSEEYQRALPWKKTLFARSKNTIILPFTLKPFEQEQELLQRLNSADFTVKERPDLFLFIVESLRDDFFNQETAPHLHQFNLENKFCDLSFSNANYTQGSWFSIFHSKLPFYWGDLQSAHWQSGAPALIALKKAGYQIHVYSSSQLSFYKMDQMIFGKGLALADSFHLFVPTEEREPWQSDAQTMAKLREDLQEKKPGGGLYIVFLESTHFDYSWPKNQTCFSTPCLDKVNYLKMCCVKDDLEGLKNRYRNAIHYMDSLFGQFLTDLKNSPRWEEAAIVLTGDHGEEFFEQGHLFHASDLCEGQTRVPLYCRIKGIQKQIMCSHIDIFPTFLHYVIGEDRFRSFFHGISLFKTQELPYSVAGRYNANRSPYEFFIHNGHHKLIARFAQESKILSAKKLHILSVKNCAEEVVPFDAASIEKEFGPALSRLFSNQ